MTELPIQVNSDSRQCVVCMSPFTGTWNQRTCSASCGFTHDRNRSREYQRSKRPLPQPRKTIASICLVCAVEFEKTCHRHVTCSLKCRKARLKANRPSRAFMVYPMLKCKQCGEQFRQASYQQVHCSSRCKAKYQTALTVARYQPKRDAATVYQCKECGKPFTKRDERQYLCSVACNAKVTSRNTARVRRARIAGAITESFDPHEVLERDGWKCHICGIKTPKRLRGTMAHNAPELDHILPIAVGGEHTRQNTACACKRCNMAKGAKPLGQLRLTA